MRSINLILICSVFVSTVGFKGCYGHRVLGIFPLQCRSHFSMFEALMKGLASRGHQVDVISLFPQKNPHPNYTDIIKLPSPDLQLFNTLTYEMMKKSVEEMEVQLIGLVAGNGACAELSNPEMQRLIKNPPKDRPYDLLITELFATNCYMALGYHLKVPTIATISTSLYPWHDRIVGNPANLAIRPNNFYAPPLPMDFSTRLYNTVYSYFIDAYFKYLTVSPQDAMVKKYIDEKIPSTRDIERNVALVLTNTHYSFNGPVPMTSAVIEVGGIHIRDDDSKIPEDLEEWMDRSTDGFVYFSFGSMLRIDSLPEHIIRVFYRSFEKISPIRVLMKVTYEEQLPPGLPKNIRTFKWLPQLKVFRHKHMKAFITHGGMLGIQEAIHFAIPMIAMPIFAEQFSNANRVAFIKIGIKLSVEVLTEETLDEALHEIFYNPIYKKKILQVSAQFHDRPMAPMDTAVWWIEYVLRRGDQSLRSVAMDLHWWQIELLDVYTAILVVIMISVFSIISFIRLIVKKLFIDHLGSLNGLAAGKTSLQ
ncbi:UDP-glucosyltransferase 2-like isoform X1 [Venturia canescens]|uniref:UDP-glucosyltransferase 2-like isoform X1 n=1 Tax=Venturia canescens TaxID=32260 RepID=UPI001C9C59C3|nr:UDP-glucosyltransferase 2-like isoform X1 [Venturia canescens]